MQPEICTRLLELNQQFYTNFADSFSATRQRIQPGIQRIINQLPGQGFILDLGCGNGELYRRLLQQGFSGTFIGLDFSAELLKLAEAGSSGQARFIQADLAAEFWGDEILTQSNLFDRILAFAVFHHLPSETLRVRVLHHVHRLLKTGGQFIHSEWQFLNSPRLASRIQSWEKVGLTLADVEAGDFLMDWRSGGHGFRYVHLFNEVELTRLADQTGFRICETYYSDGVTGNLGVYQIWEYNEI
jgi:tRNA (uracil-5-)-methyltransferase TRM9